MSGYQRVSVSFPAPSSQVTDVWVQGDEAVRRYKVGDDGALTRMHACTKPDPGSCEVAQWTCPECGLTWDRHVEAWWGLRISD